MLVLLALTLPAAVFTPAAGQTKAPPEASRPAAAADTIRLVPTTAAESLLTSSTVPAGERWSLARCVQTALERNAEVRTAHARSRQASGSALGGWSGILPSVSTEASYTQIRPDKARSQLFDPAFQIHNRHKTDNLLWSKLRSERSSQAKLDEF